MGDTKTTVTIEGRAVGLDKMAQAAKAQDKIAQAAAKTGAAAKSGQKSVEASAAAQVKLAEKTAAAQMKAAEKVAQAQVKASERAAREQVKIAERSAKEQERVAERSATLAARAQGRAREKEEREQARKAARAQAEALAGAKDERKHNFTQGFLQGLVPAASYLPSDSPGRMMRHAAGAELGSRIRGFGGGMAGSVFSGMEGLTQALAAIPGGGVLAGQLQTSMGYASKALESQKLQYGVESLTGHIGGNAGAAGAAAARRVGPVDYRGKLGVSEAEIDKELAARKKGSQPGFEESARQRMLRELGVSDVQKLPKGPLRSAVNDAARYEGEHYSKVKTSGTSQALRDEVRQSIADGKAEQVRRDHAKAVAGAKSKAASDAYARDEAPLQYGTRFGMDRNEMLQLAAGISQVSGGKIMQEAEGRRMLQVGASAKANYGLGENVSGAFQLAQRRGGLTGPGGADGMISAMNDAFAMALSGSELNDYMEQMASTITEWKNTGMPIDAKSIGSVGVEASAMGIGGVQGARLSRGLASAGRKISEEGPQSAEQLAILQDLYGFQGGGLGDYKEAMMRAESGSMQKGGLQKLMQRFNSASGGDKAGASLIARSSLKKAGISMGFGDIDLMLKQARGEELGSKEQARVAKVLKEMENGGKVSEKSMASEVAPGALQQAAALNNKQIGVGNQTLPAVQNLERQSANVANAFSTLAAGPLTAFTSKLVGISEGMEKFTAALSKGTGVLEAAKLFAGTN